MTEALETVAGRRGWIISDGKTGNDVQTHGVFDALRLEYAVKRVAPSCIWQALSPWGPVNPAERFGTTDSQFHPPWPDFAISIGRLTTPYIRRLKQLAGLKFLRLLDLYATKVTDAGLAAMEKLTQLKRLEMRGTRVKGPGFSHLANLKNLKYLVLSETSFGDEGLSHLKDLGLEHLDLWNTSVTDTGVANLAGMSQLRWLNLDGLNLTDAAAKSLAGLTNLESLNLSNNAITDAGLEQLCSLKNLKSLSLEFTQVTDEGVKKLKEALPKLKIDR
jgi:Leucine-rich repeat (LRR) protein